MRLLLIAGIFAVTGIAAVGIVLASKNMKGAEDDIDVIRDYSLFKTALLNYRKQKKGKLNDIEELRDYVDESDSIPWDRYGITFDEKFLIVRNAKHLDHQNIIKRVGGSSYYLQGKLYLSFLSLTKISSVEAVAKFNIVPPDNIYTTTSLEYDVSGCICEDNEVAEYKWENNEPRFDTAGTHIVRLKIKDKNGNWSPWTEKEISVSEKVGIKSVVAGFDSVYTIHNNGKVDIMGNNEYGQLGSGTLDPLKVRTMAVNYSNVDHISAGEYHIIMKTYDGKVMSLGRNNYGQLGVGNRSDSKIPKEIWGLESIKMVSAGRSFSGALSTSGRVYTWGDNEDLQLGNEKNPYREIPKVIDDVENIKQISFGYNHCLALTFDGRVIGWGGNNFGQLGVGFKGKTLEPTITEFTNAKYVCAGKFTSFVVTESGRVMVAGINNKSQLGIVGEKEVLFPVEILEIKGIEYMTASNGGNFVMAVDEIGSIYTWGQYSTIEETFHEKPYKIDGVKYVKSVAGTALEGFMISEKDELFKWNYHIDKREKLILKNDDK